MQEEQVVELILILYQTAEEKFGVTPIPNAAYVVDVYYKFQYFRYLMLLQGHT